MCSRIPFYFIANSKSDSSVLIQPVAIWKQTLIFFCVCNKQLYVVSPPVSSTKDNFDQQACAIIPYICTLSVKEHVLSLPANERPSTIRSTSTQDVWLQLQLDIVARYCEQAS